jgi:U3 small nucleolar RNA-associated protein 21
MSPCGTFALVGSSGGAIDMYNLQSGIHRQRYPAKLTTAQAQRAKLETAIGSLNSELPEEQRKFNRGEGKHTKAVTGIIVDNLNRTVVSCGADGKVKFWDFAKGLLLHELDWSLTSLNGIRFHRTSDLIAISCDDGSIRVVDIETRKLVRELWGAKGTILDFIFSNDGRWIISTSADSTIRVHDLSTGHLIEALRFRSQPVAIAFSTTGEYLATAHEDSVGIHLWTNKTLFSHVPTRRIGPNDIVDMDAPTASGEGGTGVIEGAFDDLESDNVDSLDSLIPSSVDQLSSDLLTLSLVPKARWQTLLHLDTIRERNKPKEAPKKPQAAPFFLPSLLSTSAPVISQEVAAIEAAPSSRITKIADPTAASTSTFTSLLHVISNSSTIDPAPLFTHLSSLPPSAADVAIRTLDPSPPFLELVAFIRALTARLRQKRDYELVQTWIAVFLRCHASVVVESKEVKDALSEWKSESEKEGKRVGELVGYVRGVVGWVGGVV